MRAPIVAVALASLALSSGARAADRDDQQRMRSLDLAFGTRGPLPSSDDRVEAWRAFVRDRLAQPAFYEHVPRALFSSVADANARLFPFVLQHERRAGRLVYYLDRPCGASEEVAVRPWWDLEQPVWICADSYHPERTVDVHSGRAEYCERDGMRALDPFCRCGEHLLSCARDEQQLEAVADAHHAEVTQTIAWVVQHRLPFSSLLTMGPTVRSDLAEVFYARARFYRTRTFTVPPPGPPSLRPRDPEFAAGLLTTPSFLYVDDARRITVSYLWQDFLCVPTESRAVIDAARLFHAGSGPEQGRLRTSPRMELASMPGCRDCHARIENAVRAFEAFTPGSIGKRWVGDAAGADPITLYVRGWNDERARGPATPQWLGEQIATQPEFVGCIVSHVEDLVFGGFAVPPALDERLRTRFGHGQDFARLVEDAVLGWAGAVP